MSVGQLSVFLENKKGRIAELLGALAQEDIPVFGFSVADVSDYGIVRILSSRGAEACDVLRGHDFTVVENRVVSVSLKAGTRDLANVVSILSNAGVNIEYMYMTTRQSVVLRVDDPDEVEGLLVERGFECLSDVQ